MFDGLLDNLDTALIREPPCVQAQIVVPDIVPIPPGVVFVVTGPVFIGFGDPLHHLMFGFPRPLHLMPDTDVRRCVDEDADQIRALLQDIIRTAADGNVGLPVRQFSQDLCLVIEQVVI